MFARLLRWDCLAVFVICLMSFAGSGAVALAQEGQPSESGAPSSTIIPEGLDDTFSPIQQRVQAGVPEVDVRDTATESEPASEYRSLWEKLAGLDRWHRANAEIAFELGRTASEGDRDTAAQIVSLWKSEDYDSAIDKLRDLEDSGVQMGLGISWKVPIAHSGQRGLDSRVAGTQESAATMNLDCHAGTGNLFAVVRWGSTTAYGAWTMNISTDNGATWAETYDFTNSNGVVDVDCVVADDYVYVAYVVGGSNGDEARMRRCLPASGLIDMGYGYKVVFDAGASSIEEVTLASNAVSFNNRVYYAAIQSDDILRFAYSVANDGTTFIESDTGSANPSFGLDMAWHNNRGSSDEFLYVSYTGTDGCIHVLGHGENSWEDWTVESAVGSYRVTSVAAYNDVIICAFEYPFIEGTGIRYRISYDAGITWVPGSLAVPDGSAVFGHFEPDVDGRNGNGFAVIYQAEAGEIDPMYYRTREGFAPGAWSDPILFSDYDVYTGSDTAIGYLPSLSGELFSHGAMYISLDPDFRSLYFDRVGIDGASGEDVTPPVVSIETPDVFDCACDTLEIRGSVGDPDGTYVGDRLEYRRVGTSSWLEVTSAFGERSGLLYNWIAGSLPEAYYQVRVVAENESGLSASDSTLIYRSNSFDELRLDTPVDGGVYGGIVCFEGTAKAESCFDHYRVRYRAVGSGVWYHVDPAKPYYTSMVTNDLLATWNTVSLGIPDGDYDVVIVAETVCGDVDSRMVTITVDNEPAEAQLYGPMGCDVFLPNASIEIEGAVADDNIHEWTLAVIGGPYSDWHTIAGPETSNAFGLLCTWETAGLPACSYTVRLRVQEESTLLNCEPQEIVVEDYTSFVVGDPTRADLDHDGDVDLDDFSMFVACMRGPDYPLPSVCENADLDGDADCDLADYSIFMQAFTGPGLP